MAQPILRGYTYSRPAARYRDTATGKFVSRARITSLLEQNVNTAEDRLSQIIQSVAAKELAPGPAQVLIRDELRRLNLSNAALGKGGIDRLDFSDYGRVGRQLRDSYQRMSNLMHDVQSGKATLPQALNRVQGYVLEARQQFFAAERAALRQSDGRFEERRRLHANESCVDCVNYAGMGWQPMGTLPLPGQASRCGSRCRCTIERREITEQPVTVRPAERILA